MSGPENMTPQVKGEEELYLRDASVKVKKRKRASTESSPSNHLGNTHGQPSSAAFSGEHDELEAQTTENDHGEPSEIIQDDDDDIDQDDRGALVIYNPEANALVQNEPVSDHVQYYTSSLPERILPSVGAFTVQCANCFKWRLIPSKEKYEEIREHIMQQPFVCDRAREWRPDISCDDPADIAQDGSRLWAIDKPSIAQPPPGWERILRIRGQGGTRFADVYYTTPTGKRLRSMPEIKKYLEEHPQFASGVKESQFSFQIPKPLQEDYVIKRTPNRPTLPMSRPLEPTEVNPLRCAGPVDNPHLQIGQPESSSRYAAQDPDSNSTPPPAKRKATKSPFKRASKSPFNHMNNSGSMYNQPEVKVEKPEAQYINVDDL